jgi:hypothetical protein
MKTEHFGIVERLREKHKERLALAQKELKKRRARPRKRFDSYLSDVILFSKWAYRVGKGWYGFSLGDVPRVWTDVLDEFLSWLEIQCPDFEIHQVKIKGRGLRLYLGTKTEFVIPDEKVRSEISQLQNLLSNPPFTQRGQAATKGIEPRISRISRIEKTFQRSTPKAFGARVAKTQRGQPQPKDLNRSTQRKQRRKNFARNAQFL